MYLCEIKVVRDNDEVKVDNVHDFIKHPDISGPQLQAGFLSCRSYSCVMIACSSSGLSHGCSGNLFFMMRQPADHGVSSKLRAENHIT